MVSKKTKKQKIYDIIIVGGGISGLYCAYNLLKNKHKILLLENTNTLGGRINTINIGKNIQYEAGAARFNNNHKLLIKLLKEFKLHKDKIPIKNTKDFIFYPPNKYDEFLEKYADFDNIINDINNLNLSENILINSTLLEIADKYLSSDYNTKLSEYMVARYPYYSELVFLNAKDALNIFKNDFNLNVQYYILKGGLSSLIKKLEQSIKKMNGLIKLNYYVDNITCDDNIFHINNQYKSTKLILALPKHALLKLNYLKPIKNLLNCVITQPLYRIYMKYPLKNGKSWFDGLSKYATNLNIKFFIPYDYSTGLIMISYTDGKYAKFWMNKLLKDENDFQNEMKNQLQKMFPNKNIPNPIWTKHHYWENGASYWKKGCDSNKLMYKIAIPTNSHLFICGESYSTHQAWIEGALETSNIVINKF